MICGYASAYACSRKCDHSERKGFSFPLSECSTEEVEDMVPPFSVALKCLSLLTTSVERSIDY